MISRLYFLLLLLLNVSSLWLKINYYFYFCSASVSGESHKGFLRTRLSLPVVQELRNGLCILQIIRQEDGSVGRKRKYSTLVNV